MKNQDDEILAVRVIWNLCSCYTTNAIPFSQSEARNFMYIIKVEIIESNALLSYFLNLLESART